MVKIFSIALKWFDTSQTIETRSILRILLCKHRQVRNMQTKAHQYDSNAHLSKAQHTSWIIQFSSAGKPQ